MNIDSTLQDTGTEATVQYYSLFHYLNTDVVTFLLELGVYLVGQCEFNNHSLLWMLTILFYCHLKQLIVIFGIFGRVMQFA